MPIETKIECQMRYRLLRRAVVALQMNGGPRAVVKLSGLLAPPASTTFDHLNIEFKPYTRHLNRKIVESSTKTNSNRGDSDA